MNLARQLQYKLVAAVDQISSVFLIVSHATYSSETRGPVLYRNLLSVSNEYLDL